MGPGLLLILASLSGQGSRKFLDLGHRQLAPAAQRLDCLRDELNALLAAVLQGSPILPRDSDLQGVAGVGCRSCQGGGLEGLDHSCTEHTHVSYQKNPVT